MNYGYNPLIRDLPPELQELAHQRQREQGNDGTFDGRIVNSKEDGNFAWEDTPEMDFWNALHDGETDIHAHPNYPKSSINYQIY